MVNLNGQTREINGAFPVIYMIGATADGWGSKGVPSSILLQSHSHPHSWDRRARDVATPALISASLVLGAVQLVSLPASPEMLEPLRRSAWSVLSASSGASVSWNGFFLLKQALK